MHGYHVNKDISELPCSPEQIFAKIVVPCDLNIPKGIAGFGQLRGSSVVSKRRAASMHSFTRALLESEDNV